MALKAVRGFNRLWKAPRQARARELFQSIRFRPGDVAVDCGANVGAITTDLITRGAIVHAFEPNPIAMSALRGALGDHERLVCIEKAVSDRNGSARLYLHRHSKRDPLGHSAGSSLMADKHNLDSRRFIDIEAVDLADYIEAMPGRIRLLKIDVEGLEAVLVNHLIDRRVIGRIDHVLCETHEYKIPGLAAEIRRLRKRMASAGIEHVNLDWV